MQSKFGKVLFNNIYIFNTHQQGSVHHRQNGIEGLKPGADFASDQMGNPGGFCENRHFLAKSVEGQLWILTVASIRHGDVELLVNNKKE